jgi:hypothetical protein
MNQQEHRAWRGSQVQVAANGDQELPPAPRPGPAHPRQRNRQWRSGVRPRQDRQAMQPNPHPVGAVHIRGPEVVPGRYKRGGPVPLREPTPLVGVSRHRGVRGVVPPGEISEATRCSVEHTDRLSLAWARRDLNPHIGEISPITDMNPKTSEKSQVWGSHASTIAGAPRPASSDMPTRSEFAPLRAHRGYRLRRTATVLPRVAHRAEDAELVEREQYPDEIG